MIVYIDIVENNVLLIKVTLTTEDSKLTLPKSTITSDGIVDGTVRNKDLFLDKIIVDKFDDDVRLTKLEDFLSKLTDDDIVYVTSVPAKNIIARLDIHSRYNNFKKYTAVGCLFIESLRSELLQLSNREEFEIDMVSYLRGKVDYSLLLNNTQNMFFYKDMPKGIYYTYHNKEKSGDNGDFIDVQKTKIVLGKKASTNSYQVFDIGEQEVIDTMYNKWKNKNQYDLYCIMLLNRLKDSKNNYYDSIGSLIHSIRPNQIKSPTGEIIISEVYPAGVSYYAFKEFEMLRTMLSEFKNDKNSTTYKSSYDITDLVYDYTGKNVTCKHKSSFMLDYKYIVNNVEYKILLEDGLDMPIRNLLNNLCKHNPRLYVLIINENNHCCRHYTVLTTDIGDVITAAIPTNLTLLENTK